MSRPSPPHTTPGIKLLYAFDNRVPSPQADTEQLVCNLAALSRRDMDVTLLVPRLGPEFDGEAIRAFYATSGAFSVTRYTPLKRPRVGQKLYGALRVALSQMARDADILYTRNLPIAVAAVTRRLPVVFETYRPWPDQYPVLIPVIRRLTRSRFFLGGIFHSELARNSHARAGAPPERLLVAHNGFEPSRMEPVLTKEEARLKLGVAGSEPLVVYTGRVSNGKGLEAVLAIAQQCPDVRFLLVGATGDDPFEKEAARVANVSLAPWQSYQDVSDWLYAADVLLVPPSSSPLENHGHTVLPIKLFSYLAAGRPIVGPSTPDVRELLVHDENAVLVPPGDAAGAARALRGLLGNQAMQERLSTRSLELAKGLTWDARALKIHEFLDRRLSRGELVLGNQSALGSKPDRGAE